MKSCFDINKYLTIQREKILERTKMFGKLYLEFGGKLLDDQHAARCIPGFAPDLKIRLLEELKDEAEVILCISARAIEENKERADYGISYGEELINEIEALRERGVYVGSVVVTLYEGQESAREFVQFLHNFIDAVYYHGPTKGYPTDVDAIVSEEGYGQNPYIETTRDLVVVSAPGPCSGKMATALNQLYHESKYGVDAGYAKFETFPVWNFPVKHPLNLAYEAATADLNDVNMIDHYHLEKYGVQATNYNRDLEIFPVLREILRRTTGRDVYYSPTDMGVNMVGFCITDDAGVREASEQEILRRYRKAMEDYEAGKVNESVPTRIKMLVQEISEGV